MRLDIKETKNQRKSGFSEEKVNLGDFQSPLRSYFNLLKIDPPCY